MRFTKMHGCGNDFVLVDGPWAPAPERVRALCDRRTGIGADGIIVVDPPHDGRTLVTVHNADGSIADACGNGYRCVARYLIERHGRDPVVLATPAGDVRAWRDGDVFATILPTPEVGARVDVRANGAIVDGVRVRAGNPNVVVFVDDPASLDLVAVATAARAAAGPANVAAAAVRARDRLAVRVHERGVGETLACGTGSCASVAAALARGAVSGGTIAVELAGGTLHVTPTREGYVLAGPAERVYEGVLP